MSDWIFSDQQEEAEHVYRTYDGQLHLYFRNSKQLDPNSIFVFHYPELVDSVSGVPVWKGKGGWTNLGLNSLAARLDKVDGKLFL